MYIVRTSCAKMPASCWGRYNRIAVLEVEPGAKPAMISTRARGVRSIVAAWEACHVGTSDRCSYRRALQEAETLANELNAAEIA